MTAEHVPPVPGSLDLGGCDFEGAEEGAVWSRDSQMQHEMEQSPEVLRVPWPRRFLPDTFSVEYKCLEACREANRCSRRGYCLGGLCPGQREPGSDVV